MEKNIGFQASSILCALVIVALPSLGMAQVGVSQSCLNNLGPFLNFLNWTSPADVYCDALSQLIKTNSECLCGLINNPSLVRAQSLNINATQFQDLPQKCGQRLNPLGCNTSSYSPTPGDFNTDSSGVDRTLYCSPMIIAMTAVGFAISTAVPNLWQ